MVLFLFLTMDNPNNLDANQNDLFMFFLAISHNGQVTRDGCNEQVFFWCLAHPPGTQIPYYMALIIIT